MARWPSGEVANASPEYEVCRNLARTRQSSAQTGDAGSHARLGRVGVSSEEGRPLMDRAQIEALLNEVHAGSTSVTDALERLARFAFRRYWDSPRWIITARCAPACRR
jgi:hypothetical protein